MARFTVRRNFKFADILKDVSPTEAYMRKLGEQLAVRIENRTLAGLDEDGKPFAPYSPEYQARKKYGRSTVDLHLASEMFKDFGVVSATSKRVALGFRTERSERLAAYHEAGAGHLPVRKFLGVPAAWVRELLGPLGRRLRR